MTPRISVFLLNISKKRFEECVRFRNDFKTYEASTFWPPTVTTKNEAVLYIIEKTITFTNHKKTADGWDVQLATMTYMST